MKFKKLLIIGVALLAAAIFGGVQVAQAAGIVERPSFSSPQYDCPIDGGTWIGSGIWTGTCTYPPSSAGHTNAGLCTWYQNTIRTYDGVVQWTYTVSCEDIPELAPVSVPVPVPVYGPGYGKCGNAIGKTDELVTLNTCQGVSVIFSAGACTGKCTVGPRVLNTAKKGLSELDVEVLGEAYVKLRNPSGGSYKICIPGEGTIYKWVSGAWVAQSTSTVSGVSCAWSSGDGNYVLVSP